MKYMLYIKIYSKIPIYPIYRNKMNCDFKVNQIPCGIQVEYNKNIDEKPIKHFEHLDNTDVSIRMPNNRYVKYSIETGDTVPNEHKFPMNISSKQYLSITTRIIHLDVNLKLNMGCVTHELILRN